MAPSYHAKLRADTKFGLLAPAHQWEALVNAAAEESSAKAEQMREYSAAAQMGLLGWLNDVLRENPNPQQATMLWTLKKGQRDLSACSSICLRASSFGCMKVWSSKGRSSARMGLKCRLLPILGTRRC
jgi:hypothetical protein